MNNWNEERQIKSKINNDVSEELFKRVKRDFDNNVANYKNEISSLSKKYCENKSKQFKDYILKFINGSPTLNEKQKNSLADVIANYKDIEIEKDADSIFIKNELKKGPKILSQFINKYDSNKLCQKYNSVIAECIIEIFSKVQSSHLTSLEVWGQCLNNEIDKQIVSLSPQLSNRAEKIKLLDDRIAKLKKNKEDLNEYYNRINELVEWKSM